MKNKKGFTLIELLAVIIILGILMIIAIPSVTKYINDSRKNAYVDTAKEIIGSARNLVNSGNLEMYDTDATYYLDVKCINTENAMKSPYGEFVDLGAYVVVTYNGKGYDYYWTSVDDAGQGIKDIVKYDKLDIENIESDLTIDDISTLRTIDGRRKVILITDRNGCKKEGPVTQNLVSVSSNLENNNNVIVYPTGKTKDTVVTGDLVKIGEEEFYVVKHDGDNLILLAHYNLKVGSVYNGSNSKIRDYSENEEGYGIQSSEARGKIDGASYVYGIVSFSNNNYWNGKVGTDYPGIYCIQGSYPAGTNCTFVYDSNSNLYQYVENYKTYLINQGAPSTISARVLRIEEAFELGCIDFRCDYNAPSWVYETSYWIGSATDSSSILPVHTDGTFDDKYYGNNYHYGVRPVIII